MAKTSRARKPNHTSRKISKRPTKKTIHHSSAPKRTIGRNRKFATEVEARLIALLERIQKELDEALDKELKRAAEIGKSGEFIDFRESHIEGKKELIEEACTVKLLQEMKKEISETITHLNNIENEHSDEIMDTYMKNLDASAGQLDKYSEIFRKIGESSEVPTESQRGTENPEKKETASSVQNTATQASDPFQTKSPENIKELSPDDLKKYSTNQLLRKIIEVQVEQQRYLKELWAAHRHNPAGADAQTPTQATLAPVQEVVSPAPGQNVNENGLKSAEQEIMLDLPSLRIKDAFKLTENTPEKASAGDAKPKMGGGWLSFLSRTPDEKTRLKNLTSDNLKKVSKLGDERKKVIGISYIIRQFLEIKFQISRTLTYSEMIAEIKSRDFDPQIKTLLIDFFGQILQDVYRGEQLTITSDFSLDLADKMVKKLGDKDKIPTRFSRTPPINLIGK